MSQRPPKRIPREEKQAQSDYQERHEVSLLKILIEKRPEKAEKILAGVKRNISLAK